MSKANQYALKDKKIELWLGEGKKVNGVTKIEYNLLYADLWAYYRQLSGGMTLDKELGIRIYDATERALFIIGRLPELRETNLGLLKVRFNGRIYDVELIDDYEGYTDDYKLTCKYSSTQSYTGMP